MSPLRFKEIREKLGLTQEELSEVFGVSGRKPISHYETGFRKPGDLIVVLMEIFDSLSEKKSIELRELILAEMRKIKKPKRKVS
ncbi:MAG: helix-turn-helix domain-containing protein [Bdellovibrionaceae bacterium]|nr:helix-turn-helix domain-containing protein [Pseudobdellovibrionaceae bacterium]